MVWSPAPSACWSTCTSSTSCCSSGRPGRRPVLMGGWSTCRLTIRLPPSGKIPGFGTTARDDGRVGTLVTLDLPNDSPIADLPWVITIGALGDEEDWEPVVCG